MKKKLAITIGWLYPDLMSIYGDRGNIIVLEQRCLWRNIAVTIKRIDVTTTGTDLKACDLLIMGGAQDRQQTIVAEDLQKKKKVLKAMIEGGTPGLFICGGYQFLGKYYKEADGHMIEQLGLLDLYTMHPGASKKRCIGNVILESANFTGKISDYVGFENHGGRTYLGSGLQPLGIVRKGFGNNGEDGTEGVLYKHIIGTYCHGPLLPKNPEIADWLISCTLEKKYRETISLETLDDTLAKKAREEIRKKKD